MAVTPSDEHAKRHDEAVLAAVEAQTRGQLHGARELFGEALEHALELGCRRKIHAAKINLSSCLLSLGEHAAARRGLPEIVLESDDPRHISAAAGQLAEAFMKDGRLERAATYVRTSLEHARQCRDRWQEGWSLIMRGHLGVLTGRHEEAVEHYQQALALHELLPTGDRQRHALAAVLDNLGYAMLLADRLPEGLRALRRGLRVARAEQASRLVAEIEKDMAFGFLLADRNPTAENRALRALELAEREGYDDVRRNCCYLLMELSLRQEKSADFEEYFQRLQALMPGVRLSRSFFRIFDISDVINLKEF